MWGTFKQNQLWHINLIQLDEHLFDGGDDDGDDNVQWTSTFSGDEAGADAAAGARWGFWGENLLQGEKKKHKKTTKNHIFLTQASAMLSMRGLERQNTTFLHVRPEDETEDHKHPWNNY